MTPGCRNVLSFRAAFLARGRRDLLEADSKAKTLQSVPSSCKQSGRRLSVKSSGSYYPLRGVMQRPDGLVIVDSVAESVWEGTAFCNCGGDSGL